MTSLFFTEYEANVDLHRRMQSNPWQSVYMNAYPLDFLERVHLPSSRGAVSTSASQGAYSSADKLYRPSAVGQSGNGMVYDSEGMPIEVGYGKELVLLVLVAGGIYYFSRR